MKLLPFLLGKPGLERPVSNEDAPLQRERVNYFIVVFFSCLLCHLAVGWFLSMNLDVFASFHVFPPVAFCLDVRLACFECVSNKLEPNGGVLSAVKFNLLRSGIDANC